MSNTKSCFNCIHGMQNETLVEAREVLCKLTPNITLTYTQEEMDQGTALQDVPELCWFHNLEGKELNKAYTRKAKAKKSDFSEEDWCKKSN